MAGHGYRSESGSLPQLDKVAGTHYFVRNEGKEGQTMRPLSFMSDYTGVFYIYQSAMVLLCVVYVHIQMCMIYAVIIIKAPVGMV